MSLENLSRLIILTFIACIVYAVTYEPPAVLKPKAEMTQQEWDDYMAEVERTARPEGSTTDKLYAYRLATHCVKRQLNDPESAQFPNNERLSRIPAVSGSNPYKVVSTVRARNGFGGLVQRSWVATVNTDTNECECYVIE